MEADARREIPTKQRQRHSMRSGGPPAWNLEPSAEPRAATKRRPAAGAGSPIPLVGLRKMAMELGLDGHETMTRTRAARAVLRTLRSG